MPSLSHVLFRNSIRRIRALEPVCAAPSGTVRASSAAAAAIPFAFQRLGTPYEWGGNGSDDRFDCSGLTQAAHESAGIRLPRTAAEQWYAGPHVPRDQLQPGDLVFFATDLTSPASIHHVGIYVGDGEMIALPHRRRHPLRPRQPSRLRQGDPAGRPLT